MLLNYISHLPHKVDYDWIPYAQKDDRLLYWQYWPWHLSLLKVLKSTGCFSIIIKALLLMHYAPCICSTFILYYLLISCYFLHLVFSSFYINVVYLIMNILSFLLLFFFHFLFLFLSPIYVKVYYCFILFLPPPPPPPCFLWPERQCPRVC